QPITNDLVVAGFLNDNAPDFKALTIFIEHRYYGETAPFGSLDKAFDNTNNLGYFTSAQALADYAEVLMSLKKNLSAESCPVIVMGGSYGGMLASWFRLKYPHIAMGALASSAPILYFEDIVPQDIYYVIATNDFKEASMNCYKTIRKSWSTIDKIASQANGFSLLSKKFKTCKPISDSSELKNYLDSMYNKAAQYDAPPGYPVNQICDAIDKASKTTTDTLSRIAAGFIALNGKQKCYDLQAGNSLTYDKLGWYWQTCTDLVIPMGKNRDNTMFPVAPYNLNNYTKSCQAIFDDTVKARPHWIVNEFGGHDIKRVLKKFGSNIIFSNGLRDPYSGGGVLQNISNTLVAIKAAKGSHCLDIQYSSKDDPIWLTKMRASIIKIMKDWLAEYYKML
ncbi:Lysosomal pro-x carboxypeptidase, partial [Thalictrum thalictroides]